MSNPFLRSLNPWVKLLFFILLAIVSSGFFAGIGMVAISAVQNVPLENMDAYIQNVSDENVNSVMILNTLIVHLGLFLAPSFLFMFFFGVVSVDGFWFKKIDWRILVTILAMISLLPLIEFLINFNSWLIPEGSWLESKFKPTEARLSEMTRIMMIMPDWGTYLKNVFLVAIIPAIAEEIAFRGVIQSQIAKHTGKIHLAIWFSAFLFSFIHMQFYGFLPRLFLGAFFGYLLIWTGTIWAPIIAHFINNFLSVTIDFYAQHSERLSIEDIESVGVNWSILLGSIFLSVILIRGLLDQSRWPGIKSMYLFDLSKLPPDESKPEP